MNPAAQRAKYKNIQYILEYLLRQGETTRVSMANAFGLSMATVTNLISELIQQGLVVESRLESAAVGRKATLLKFNERYGSVLCVEICLDNKLALSACDLVGQVLASETVPLALAVTEQRPAPAVQRDIIGAVSAFHRSLPETVRKSLCAAAVAVCGLVDNRSITSIPYYDWKNMDLYKPLHTALQLPVYMDNVTRMRAVYELRYVSREEKNVLFLNLSSGIGMANFFDGKIVMGCTGISGEAGHMSLDVNGPLCYCGNRGCFELYCGYQSILRQAEALLTPDNRDDVWYRMISEQGMELSFDTLTQAYEAGSLCVQSLFNRVTGYLGAGIASLFNIYDPDRIIVSGYHPRCDGFFLHAAEAEARSRIVNKFQRDLRLTPAKLRDGELPTAMTAYVLSRILGRLASGGPR